MLPFTWSGNLSYLVRGFLYESWSSGDGSDRRVSVASLGARKLRAAGTARRDLASRHPRRNDEKGRREVLPQPTAKQQLIPKPFTKLDPRREHVVHPSGSLFPFLP